MLSLEIIERMLVNCIVVNARLDEPVDALLSRLLSQRPGYSARATDGVVFEQQLVTPRQVVATGLATMFGQTIEPVRVELALDAGRRQLVAGSVCFGDASRTVSFGWRDHRALRDQLLVDPQVDFAWKERFRRADDGWRAEAG
jgi:hypothetical protein